jgi:glycosyltransferase involved in cell wall biosynthesis
MLNNKKIVCVLPAYNAQKTLERTLSDVPPGVVDQYILVDDCSTDETVATAKKLADRFPLKVFTHEKRRIRVMGLIKKLVMT